MKTSLLLLSCAATLAMASCSQEKTAESTTDGAVTTTTTTTTTSPALYTDAAYNSRADRIAADIAAKMKLDDATRTKVRTVYYTRSKRLGELHDKYATDTTGMAADMRSVYADTDTELKTVFTDPTQYSAYETSRQDYYEDRYMDDASMASDASMDSSNMSTSSSMSSSDQMSSSDNSAMASGADAGVTKLKAKADDGSKIKVKDNGKVKTKDSDGNKAKTE